VVAADFDRDGDPDLVIRNLQTQSLQVLRNDLKTSRGALTVKLKQQGQNPDAIGALITLQCGVKQQIRQITAGHSFLAQSPFEAQFGLGDCSSPITVSVKWPSGPAVSYQGLEANQLVTIDRDTGPKSAPLIRSAPLPSTLLGDAKRMVFKRPAGKEEPLLAAGDNRKVIVNIWAPWCTACKKEIPALKTWAKANEKTHRVLYMSFQMDELKVVQSTAKTLGIDTVIGTPEFFERYLPESAVEIPVTLMLSSRGAPLRQFFGANFDWSGLQ
jgi:thiol-disulfide isomerase/thioredoxin